MNIYIDSISIALGITPQSEPIDFDYELEKSRSDNNKGSKTWDKESWPEHPFANSDFQNKRVADGTHHLLNSVCVIGSEGDTKIMKTEDYYNQTEYVTIQSNAGYILRGLDPTKDRPTNLGKLMPYSDDAPQRQTGDERSEAQKLASIEHSKKLKGRVSNRKGVILSDEARSNMSKAAMGVPKGPQKIVSCPHCDKQGGGSMMKRWHFDNCKHKTGEY